MAKVLKMPTNLSKCSIRTNDCQMSASGNACDYVGSDTFPFSVVFLTERSELQAATWKGVVLASTGLPYLGQTTEEAQGKEGGEKTQLRGMLQEHGSRVTYSGGIPDPPCWGHVEASNKR